MSGPQKIFMLVLFLGFIFWPRIWPALRRAGRTFMRDMAQNADTPISTHDIEVCYQLLGVSPSASWDEVQRAYRRKAKLHHPDHGGDEDTMRALNEAYARIKRLRLR